MICGLRESSFLQVELIVVVIDLQISICNMQKERGEDKSLGDHRMSRKSFTKENQK